MRRSSVKASQRQRQSRCRLNRFDPIRVANRSKFSELAVCWLVTDRVNDVATNFGSQRCDRLRCEGRATELFDSLSFFRRTAVAEEVIPSTSSSGKELALQITRCSSSRSLTGKDFFAAVNSAFHTAHRQFRTSSSSSSSSSASSVVVIFEFIEVDCCHFVSRSFAFKRIHHLNS